MARKKDEQEKQSPEEQSTPAGTCTHRLRVRINGVGATGIDEKVHSLDAAVERSQEITRDGIVYSVPGVNQTIVYPPHSIQRVEITNL